MALNKKIHWMTGLLAPVFLLGTVLLTSCDKDDDDSGSPAGNGNGGNQGLEKGSYEMTIEGYLNDTLSGDSAIFVDTIPPPDTSAAGVLFRLVNLKPGSPYSILHGVLTKQNSTLIDQGTYEQLVQDDPNNLSTGARVTLYMEVDSTIKVFTTVDGRTPGHIEITNRSETELIGTINDVRLLVDLDTGIDSITVNGKFHAQEGSF